MATAVNTPLHIWIKKKDSGRYVNNDRIKFLSAESYYNNKYPKRNITFPKIELDRRNIHSSKDITLYNVDIRTI